MKLNDTVLKDAAGELKIPVKWLYNIIKHESGGNPVVVSKFPYNVDKVERGEKAEYAAGLIQFIKSSAAGLGFKDQYDLINKLKDFNSQIKMAVVPYFKKLMPFTSENDFYMSVFFPAYRKKPIYTIFPSYVRNSNPGIVTIADYVSRVKGGEDFLFPLIVVVAGISLIILSKRKF